MDDQEIQDQQKQSVSFLLEEYKHLAESFLRNEELGERRFNFFIALTTAVIGALVAISKVFDSEVDPIFFFFVLVVQKSGQSSYEKPTELAVLVEASLRYSLGGLHIIPPNLLGTPPIVWQNYFYHDTGVCDAINSLQLQFFF